MDENFDIKNLFTSLQVGSITQLVDTVHAESPPDWVLQQMEAEGGSEAVPIERNGTILGILSKVDLLQDTKRKIFSKDLDSHFKSKPLALRADEYVELVLGKCLEANKVEGSKHFVVNFRRSYMGIVSLEALVTRANELRHRDLALAREMQQHLLGKRPGRDARYSLFAFNRMAHEVGGDFYQEYEVDPDHKIVACFDVAGKGLAASLLTSIIGAFFSSLRIFGSGDTMYDIPNYLDEFIKDLSPLGSFVAGVFCFLDYEKGKVNVLNCGFTPIHAFYPYNGKLAHRSLKPDQPPLGLGDIPSGAADSAAESFDILPGSRFVMYSDGFTDMRTLDGILYGDERAASFVKGSYAKSAEAFEADLATTIQEWIGEAMQTDDITLLDLRFL